LELALAVAFAYVLCLGDSLTAGVGASFGHTYPEQLAPLLGMNAATVPDSLGHGGTTMQHTSGASGPPYITSYAPLVGVTEATFATMAAQVPGKVAFVLTFGANDSKVANWDAALSPARFAADYAAFIAYFRGLSTGAGGSPTIYLGLPPYVDASNPYGIQPAVLTGTIQPLIRAIASANGCQVIDLYTPTQAHYPAWYTGNGYNDATHLNDAGYAGMAAVVAAALAPLVPGQTMAISPVVETITQFRVNSGALDLVNGNILTLFVDRLDVSGLKVIDRQIVTCTVAQFDAAWTGTIVGTVQALAAASPKVTT
jgi:lysophospholipase L1-like esterase